jgi:DNA adenine methylase
MSPRSNLRATGRPIEPLLRWAGSKRALLDELEARRPSGQWRYVEPFAGSACFFFALQPERALITDRNARLMETYRVLCERPDDLAKRVHAWPTDSATYYEVRSQPDEHLSPLDRSARFIYLNRLCFNGVYRTNRKGQFNVPYGRDTGAVPSLDRFRSCGELLRRAELRAADFETTLASAGPGDFVYLDPPYSRAISDGYGVYGYGSFDANDLDRLLRSLKRLDNEGAQVLLSYTWHPRLQELGSNWDIDEVAVHAQVGGRASSRTTRREVLVANYNISGTARNRSDHDHSDVGE